MHIINLKSMIMHLFLTSDGDLQIELSNYGFFLSCVGVFLVFVYFMLCQYVLSVSMCGFYNNWLQLIKQRPKCLFHYLTD